MRATKIGRVFSALVLVTLSAASAQAAGKPATLKAATGAVVKTAPVTVLLGTAMLEEYHGGDPSTRTTLYRGGDSAQKTATAVKPKA